MPNRSTYISLYKYAFKNLYNSLRNTKRYFKYFAEIFFLGAPVSISFSFPLSADEMTSYIDINCTLIAQLRLDRVF